MAQLDERDRVMFPRWPVVAIGPVRDARFAQQMAGRLAELGVLEVEVLEVEVARGEAGAEMATRVRLQARRVSLIDELMNLPEGARVRAVEPA